MQFGIYTILECLKMIKHDHRSMYINLQVLSISSDVRSISSTGPWLAGRTTVSQDQSLVLIGWAPDIVAGYNVVQLSDVNLCDVICATWSYQKLLKDDV